MFTSYAQHFEDVRLWRALADCTPGFYVDVGAQDPVVDSVSRGFYEQGWRGVHVEPVPAYVARLQADRPDEPVIAACAGPAPHPAQPFFVIPGTGLSTGLGALAVAHQAAGYAVQPLTVPVVPLDAVFTRCPGRPIHWLKIDAEGMEAAVLAGWRGPERPWVVVIESTRPLTLEPTHAAWEADLVAKGYTCVAFDGVNRFYVHISQAPRGDRLAAPPTALDDVVLAVAAAHPWTRAWQAARDAAVARAEAAEATLAAITASRSWRWTAPLRRWQAWRRRRLRPATPPTPAALPAPAAEAPPIP